MLVVSDPGIGLASLLYPKGPKELRWSLLALLKGAHPLQPRLLEGIGISLKNSGRVLNSPVSPRKAPVKKTPV